MDVPASLAMRMVCEVHGTRMGAVLVTARRQHDRQISVLTHAATWRGLRSRNLIDGTGKITKLGAEVANRLDQHPGE